MSFDSLGLPPALVQALQTRKLDTPLPVQEAALPVLMAGKSAMLVSRTGSGKTLAYLLPILAGINAESMHVQAVVLAPTHELAMQIHRVATDLSRDAGLGVRVQSLIGGAAVSRQIEGLKKKPHLVIGSAGRMTHLMELGKLKLKETLWLVLDEADRLLIEEGLEHIRKITGQLGPETRFVFVSATEGPATTRIARGLAPNLDFVRTQDGISPAIRHCYLVCEERDKTDWLRKVLRGLSPERALVFVHRGASAERMSERLEHHQLAVADLHGAHDKFERQAALDDFRKGKAQTLIASDIAARGLDIFGVELVVNVDVPSQSRDYLHRAGRTGRAGAEGLVLSLMTEAESRLAKRYAQDLDIALEQVQLVRGALVPATGDSAQTLRPAPRPFGPGRGGKKRPDPAGPETRKESAATTPPTSARQPQSHDKAAPPVARKRGPALPGAKSGKAGQKVWSGPKRNKPA
ncbi:Superfamily II DNA and RNA helicase [Desulfomicrobium apsheronum]|uniref:Superfamily II DNA and RNA helicase n=1 Tax=Desulfomicrobium apsheronum TaxID=52560 RepID=A0A1I3MV68_9BACT|nr:DEAD/DEAH box helicase [Desulfomicrobium apsheronum]SFJ00897.1 Superfamily II DNA and RNA helicase [Desulfomicrobium apsheronum]